MCVCVCVGFHCILACAKVPASSPACLTSLVLFMNTSSSCCFFPAALLKCTAKGPANVPLSRGLNLQNLRSFAKYRGA